MKWKAIAEETINYEELCRMVGAGRLELSTSTV